MSMKKEIEIIISFKDDDGRYDDPHGPDRWCGWLGLVEVAVIIIWAIYKFYTI